MKHPWYIISALSLILCGGANAATFELSFLYDGDTTPGGGTATTLSELIEYGTGTVEVKDSAITPGGLATFASGDITGFNVTMVDNLGKSLEWDFFDDGNNFTESSFGIRFDDAGTFERFDSPEFSFCSGCFEIFDDEYETPFRITQGPSLMIVDEALRFGYLTEDVMKFGMDYNEGDIVLLSNFEDAPVQAFSNIFTAENSESSAFASGFILSTGMVPGDMAAVPLPAGFPMLLGGLAGFGFLGRRRKARINASISA